MIRFAICDDDQSMTGYLDNLLMALNPLHGQEFDISVFFSGEDFCEYLNKSSDEFDIVLMDIEMRGITGIEAGKKLRENVLNDLTLLIFVSSHQTYYKEIVDLSVFCFIPKPIYEDEFNLKINKAINRVVNLRQISKCMPFNFRQNKKEFSVPLNEIYYLESRTRIIIIHMKDVTYEYYGVLDEEAKKLTQPKFVRIHKSHLINLDYVTSFTSKEVTMQDGCTLVVSTKYREDVKTSYLRYRGNDV